MIFLLNFVLIECKKKERVLKKYYSTTVDGDEKLGNGRWMNDVENKGSNDLNEQYSFRPRALFFVSVRELPLGRRHYYISCRYPGVTGSSFTMQLWNVLLNWNHVMLADQLTSRLHFIQWVIIQVARSALIMAGKVISLKLILTRKSRP